MGWAVRFAGHQRMSGFQAEMWNIHDRSGVVSDNGQSVSAGNRLQPFARLEHGERAQKPGGVQNIIVSHDASDRRDVSSCPQGCDFAVG